MSALLLVLLCPAELLLFLLPGFATLTVASGKRIISGTHALVATIAISAALGYLAFWIYLWNKTAGQVFSYVAMIAAVALLITNRKKCRFLIARHDFILPLVYTLCLSLFYLSLLYLFVNPIKAGVDVANVRFFPETRPGDNIIPFIFAQRIYDRAPIRPFCCGDWLSSDRPPLQAGIFLLQRPLRVAGNTGLQYQLLGTLLQCLWVCAIWTLLRTIGIGRTRVDQTIGLLAFSGFLFYNSAYVWPKLLAATFIVFVYSILSRAALDKRPLTGSETVLGSLCFVLALLAHPGSVFSAPAVLIFLIWRRNLLSLRDAAAALVLIGVFLVPWTLYQKFYDPPGDRLLKMHLAGIMEPDSRNIVQALRDSYSRLSAKEIVEFKWANVETVLGVAPWRGMRVSQREYIPEAIGILNLGWFVAAIQWVRRRRTAALPYTGYMIAAALLNLLVWCVIMFGPAQTMTEHGSYADILLLSLASIAFLLAAPKIVALLVMALQALNLIFVWVLFRPGSFTLPSRAVVPPSLQGPMFALALSLGAAGLWYFGKSYFRPDSAAAIADPLFEQKAQQSF